MHAAWNLLLDMVRGYHRGGDCNRAAYPMEEKTQKREKRPGVPDAAETVVRVQAARRVRERQKIKRCRTE